MAETEELNINHRAHTWDILPNKEAELVLRLCGVKLAAPLALSVCWSSINNVDVLHNQYANTSLLSGTFNEEVSEINCLRFINTKSEKTWMVQHYQSNKLSTSMAEAMVCIIRSKTLVLSTSKDLQWSRHLYMRQAAIGLPPEKPKSCEMHLISKSWFSCKKDKIVQKIFLNLTVTLWLTSISDLVILWGKQADHAPAAFHLETSVVSPQMQAPLDLLQQDSYPMPYNKHIH